MSECRVIRVLPENVANQIAAGEVVERPASVVKELVENALDAGATRIDVSVEGGGSKCVEVGDNGCGMAREDALACLERQATSKIATVGDIDRNTFHVQCGSCEELLSEEEEYCPSCGEKLPEGIFEERSISPIAQFCEEAIAQLGINPVLAREATDAWVFHNGSSEIRLFVYDNDYLFTTSPIVLLPKKNVEDMLTFMLSTDFGPYKLGVDGKQIYIAYRIHLSDINDDTAAEIQQNIVNIARKADELDNYMVERFGCEFSEYSKTDNKAK